MVTSNIHLERIVTSLAKILVFVARCGSGLFPILDLMHSISKAADYYA